MVPWWQKSPKWLNLRIKDIGYDQGHQVIDPGVIWKGFISLYMYMPNMKSLSSNGSEVKAFFEKKTNNKRQRGQKLDALSFHSKNRKINLYMMYSIVICSSCIKHLPDTDDYKL